MNAITKSPSEPTGKPLTAYAPESRPAISSARARLAARMPPLLAAMNAALAQYSRDVQAHEHQRDHDDQRQKDWTR